MEETFGAFLASKKNLLSLQMKSKANKGKGRFSFIAFSSNAEWHTVYKDNNVYKEIEPALLKDFAWFLYLYKNKNVEIVVNDERIDYEKYINTELSEKSMITIGGYRFEINLVVWQESISEKFCCYYFDDKNVLKGKRTTTFNRNTINFNHSVFVKSEFFDDKENVISDLMMTRKLICSNI